MPLSLWFSLAAICTLGAMSPGPSLALVLRHTLGGGRVPGVTAALFHALGVGFYALLTVLGLGALMARFPGVFELITWLGAGYLAWLGFKALRAGRSVHFTANTVSATTRQQAAREAVLVALANPKLILFFVALLSQFVTPDMSAAGRAIIVLTAMIIDGGWYVLVAWALSHSTVLIRLRRNAHWVNRVSGVLLIALALRVVIGPLA
ncbi:LysE family translocator [Halomonas dongshanensis]|uniref:LysE family translocator n=1 Tax=Halomonas dongshanensis TaxID=2890835 RepID=A0ABT2EDH3_9GAMM|nr:LysE family translocator [Halomonas dongshanensis]MCS2609600.1 LysE family translocator [Halomonas dongshanensis]